MVFQMTANKQMRQNSEKKYADKSYTWTEMKFRHWSRYRWICSKTGQRKWLLFSLKLNSKRKNVWFLKNRNGKGNKYWKYINFCALEYF